MEFNSGFKGLISDKNNG